MTASEESFEIFSHDGSYLGQAPRTRVHREGLWHKSAQVFLFDDAGRLYLQRRAEDKDVCGGLWDHSVGEHLKPGESYLAGAERGLVEELGVRGVGLEPLGQPVAARLDQPELQIHDNELQQAFRGVYSGPLTPDPVEVAEVRAVDLTTLDDWIRAAPEDFTPWLLRDVVRCGILPSS